MCNNVHFIGNEWLRGPCGQSPGGLFKTIERLTKWNKQVSDDLDKILGTPHEGSAINRVVVLGAEFRRLTAIANDLPQCYRLKDGKLVQDVPLTPQMGVWRSGHQLIFREIVLCVHAKVAWLQGKDSPYLGNELANSYEAAERLAKQ